MNGEQGIELRHRIWGNACVYFHPLPFWLLFSSSSHLNSPYVSRHTLKTKQKNQTASCYRMPWTWQTTESHYDISAALWKTCKVPITQAFRPYRKSRLGRFCLFVKGFKAVLYSYTADSPPAKGPGHVLPAQPPSAAGHRPWAQPPSAPGQDGPADTERPPAPSPDRAAHHLLQYTFLSFSISLFRLYLRITRFTSYEVLLLFER